MESPAVLRLSRRFSSLREVMRFAVCAAVLALSAFCGVGSARADGLTATEQARLDNHETVTRESTLDRGDHHYVGGLAYTVIDAPPADVARMFDDPYELERVLPKTKSAAFVGATADGDRLLQITQGNALMEATYTLRVRREAGESRFWLDSTRPHGIDDAWGFFRYQPISSASGETRTLLTYGILVDVGNAFGLVGNLFEDRLRAALLSVPQRVQQQVALRVARR